jgi:hypothetical protein
VAGTREFRRGRLVNPYYGRAPHTYWRQGVAELPWDQVDPVTDVPFTIGRGERIATAGSCFAQHISATLAQDGYNYFITERFAGQPGTVDENYGVFPARFGNIYTPKQLLQLFDRAYGLFRPRTDCLALRDGGSADPFRPRIQAGGFQNRELLEADRARHLAAVREMFERSDVFIFTLGLTEYWSAPGDGAVYPLPPGVFSDEPAAEDCRFGNFGVAEMVGHLAEFIGKLRQVNRAVRLVLTVSPVPLIATYEDRHVLVSTIVSKSALRAAVDEICRNDPHIAYFPAYELIVGPQAAGRFFRDDLREVSPEGVAHVMSLFREHFLLPEGAVSGASTASAGNRHAEARQPGRDASRVAPGFTVEQERRHRELARIVCDEEALVRPSVINSST